MGEESQPICASRTRSQRHGATELLFVPAVGWPGLAAQSEVKGVAVVPAPEAKVLTQGSN